MLLRTISLPTLLQLLVLQDTSQCLLTPMLVSVVSPALTLLHECQNHNTAAAIHAPFVKLLLTGAKREAAERCGPVKKAPVLSQSQINQVVDLLWKKGVGVLDKSISLATWRTIVRIYTYTRPCAGMTVLDSSSHKISYWERTMFNSPLPEARMINITMVP